MKEKRGNSQNRLLSVSQMFFAFVTVSFSCLAPWFLCSLPHICPKSFCYSHINFLPHISTPLISCHLPCQIQAVHLYLQRPYCVPPPIHPVSFPLTAPPTSLMTLNDLSSQDLWPTKEKAGVKLLLIKALVSIASHTCLTEGIILGQYNQTRAAFFWSIPFIVV